MRRITRIVLPFLFILIVVISSASVKLMSDIENYGKLINYVGVVRGGMQRIVKLETNQSSNEQLMKYIDEILDELLTGSGCYGLERTRCSLYNDNLVLLNKQWNRVKEEIAQFRRSGYNTFLMDESEKLDNLANDAVFAIEAYSNMQINYLSKLILVTAVTSVIACILLFTFYIKKFFQLKKTNEVLEDKAYKDELTGAYNLEKFKAEVSRTLRNNPDKKFAVLYIDFENFKYVNDVFGYEYGDDILKKYAGLMKESLEKNEIFGRDVADRFTVLRQYEDREEMLKKQEKVDEEFLALVRTHSNRHMVTIACGFCCIEDLQDKVDVETLLDRANFAQKTVKNIPGKYYGFYDDSIRESMIKEMTIQDRMQEALDNKEFIVYIQPKVRIAKNEIACGEALVRWKTPDRGLIPPCDFIPVFEKNHFISVLDQYVFEEVCGWLRNRLEKGEPVVPISVNVSKVQLYNPDFVNIYADIKKRFGIPDRFLEVEFTETAAFGNQEYMMQVISDLHKKGFLCSLDDFGSGYSSLGMLKNLSIDILKLDAAFFRESSDIGKEQTIIKSIVSMIKELNIETVAEGIEQKEQVEFLERIGCDLVQGYFYYKPMPINEFEVLL